MGFGVKCAIWITCAALYVTQVLPVFYRLLNGKKTDGWCIAGIIFVMFSGARRLELRQNRNYGNDPEYQAYVKKVPILLPFIPLYSVAKYKFLVA